MGSALTGDSIRKLAMDEGVFKRGCQYYEDGRVVEIGLKNNGGLNTVRAMVLGAGRKIYTVNISLADTGLPESYACNCDAASIWKGACKHTVATLITLATGNNAEIKKHLEDDAKENVLEHFRNRVISGIAADFASLPLQTNAVKATITPTLYVNREQRAARALLGLSVGYRRSYVVRDIRAFVQHVDKRAVVQYGKGLVLNHDISGFCDKSQQLVDALRRLLSGLDEFELSSGGFYGLRHLSANKADRIFLPAMFTDTLFEIYKDGLTVDAAQLGKKPFIMSRLKDQSALEFNVLDEGDILTIEKPDTPYTIVQGKQFHYFLTHSGFVQMESAAAEDFNKLQTLLTRTGSGKLTFEGEQAYSFRSLVLPVLQNASRLTNAAPGPTPTPGGGDTSSIHFYLDVDNTSERLTCQIKLLQPQTDTQDATALPWHSLAQAAGETFEELWATAFIRHYGFSLDPEQEYFYLQDDDKIFDFMRNGVEKANSIGEVFATASFDQRAIRKSGSVASVGARIKGNLLELELSLGEHTIPQLMEALASYRIAKRFHRLKSGSFIDLEAEGVASALSLLEQMDISKKDISENNTLRVPIYRAAELEEELSESGGRFSFDEAIKHFLGAIRKSESQELSLYKVPESLKATLRSYQETGFRWLKTFAEYGLGAILADEMGLGKTLQIIALLASAKEEGLRPGATLPWAIVVAPTSLIYNWEAEIKRFAPSLEVCVVTGPPARRKELVSQNADCLITTYDTLKRDIENYDDFKFEYIIADEAQYMKNQATKNATVVKSIKGRVRFALTGTPIENSLSELWSIFDFALPGLLHNHARFMKRYETPITRDGDENAAMLLRRRVAPFILRRKKTDVLSELPDKTSTTLVSTMTQPQRLLYNAKLMEAKGIFEQFLNSGNLQSHKIDILAMITRLRQICAHPSLFLEDYSGGSGKLEELFETLSSVLGLGHRVLLFSQFTSMLGILSQELRNRGISFFYLDGKTEPRLRKTMVDQFNNGDKQIFLISLKAGGLGLNLTGADVVIHYDQWWNPAIMSQATDRAHRFGQQRSVQVFNLIAKDSIEEKIILLQERKQALVDSVISENSTPFNSLNDDELREIFDIS